MFKNVLLIVVASAFVVVMGKPGVVDDISGVAKDASENFF